MENSKQPMYPINIGSKEVHPYQLLGLTKREYFAAMALQGIMIREKFEFRQQSMSDNVSKRLERHKEEIAYEAIECADELLKQLESNQALVKGEGE